MFFARRSSPSAAWRKLMDGGVDAASFTEAFIAVAPEAPGVYFLYRSHQVIYIGIAVHGTGIRQQLEKHFKGLYGPRTRSATSFDYEKTNHAVVVRHEYLLLYREQHRGRLPACNEHEA